MGKTAPFEINKLEDRKGIFYYNIDVLGIMYDMNCTEIYSTDADAYDLFNEGSKIGNFTVSDIVKQANIFASEEGYEIPHQDEYTLSQILNFCRAIMIDIENTKGEGNNFQKYSIFASSKEDGTQTVDGGNTIEEVEKKVQKFNSLLENNQIDELPEHDLENITHFAYDKLQQNSMETKEELNGYICIWGGNRKEIYAKTSYAAQQAAEVEFQKETRKRVKGYDISTTLCEKNGAQITHSTSCI